MIEKHIGALGKESKVIICTTTRGIGISELEKEIIKEHEKNGKKVLCLAPDDEIIRESNLSTSCKNSMLKALWIKEDGAPISNSRLSDFAKIPYNDWKKYLGFGVKTIEKTKQYLKKKNIPIIY